MAIKTIKTSYNAGELSEYMAGRTDISKYHNGCSQLINATVLPHGGVVKRPGTKFIAKAPNKCKLIPFEFSVSDSLVLEFSNLLIRFYKDGDRVMTSDVTISDVDTTGATEVTITTSTNHGYSTGDTIRVVDTDSDMVGFDEGVYNGNHATEWAITVTGLDTFTLDSTDGDNFTAWTSGGYVQTIYEIVSPYTSAQAFEFHYTQSADVMYIAHEDHPPQKLSRLSDTSWTIADIDFEGGPFLDENLDTTKTLTFTETARTTGAHDGAANQSGQAGQPVTDSGESWTVNEFAGMIIVNKTDGSWGTIASNTATTITVTAAGMANGTDNDFDAGDAFEIYDFDLEQGFYHAVGDTGTLTSTGHTPFNSNHVGSVWQISKTRVGDNYVSVAGASAAGVSSPIEIKGDFYLDAAGVISGVTVTLERKEGDGDWQDYRKFTAAVAFSATELEDDVFYRVNISGTTDATTNVTLTAKEQISFGEVEVTAFSTSSSVSVAVTKKLFRDVTSDVNIEGLQYGNGSDVEVTSTGHTLSNGDIVLVKNVSRADFSGLNYDATSNNIYVVTGKTANTFRLANSDGDVTGNAAKQTVGVGEYYEIGNTTSGSMWSEGAWSDYRGYPRTNCFYEDRLWWASSTNNPDTIWGSRSGLYEDMSYTLLGADDEAIIAPILDNEISQIQWMVGRRVMAVGAANKEYRFGASDPDKAVTPSDKKSIAQTSFGSDDIQPVILNDAIFYFQRQGRTLRAMKFDAITENFQSDNANLLANTIFESAPVNMAAQRVPDSIIWIPRDDGVLCTFTYEPDEEVAGWARMITQNTADVEIPVGFFESACVIHGDTEDEVWVSVRRVVSGSTVYYTEQFATRLFDQIDEAMMLDCAKVVTSGFTSKTITYAGDTVRYGASVYGSSIYTI